MDLRRTGIEIIGDVPWGTHFCNFYNSRQDLLDILVPYFKAGLEDNEFCMWITAEPLGVEDAIKAMQKAVGDFDTRLARGQIEILPYDQWYIKDGAFDSDRVLEGWLDKLDAARAKGYAGLRLTGNTFWLEKKDWDSFLAYEDQVNNVIGKYRMLAICTYSLKKCDASEVIDVVNTHQFALAKRDGKWDRLENTQRTEAERRVRARLEQALSPDGDIGQLELSDIIDAQAIQLLMEEFNKLVRIPMAVIDLNGKTLVGVGWQDICTKFHRVNSQTCQHCIDSDTKLSEGVEAGEFKLYKCKNNMWDVATPLIVGGRHVGNLFMGQFFFEDETVDYDLFRAQAKAYGFDEDEYLAALDRVPRLSRDAVNTAMSYCARLAHMISQLSYSNIKLARTLARGEALNVSLRESRELLAVTLASIGDGVIMTDVQGNVTFLNTEAERLTGWKNDQAQGVPLDTVFNIINEKTRKPVESPAEKVLREGGVVGLANHTVLITKDGREIPIDDSGAPIKSADGTLYGVVLVFRDFSRQKAAEAEIRSLARFPDENPNSVMRVTTGGKLLYANESAAALLTEMGYKKGRRLPPALRAPLEAAQWENADREFELIAPSKRIYSFVLALIQEEGYANLYGRDITDRKRAEQELRASLDRYRSFLEVTGQVGWTTDPEGQVTEDLPAWSRFTGQTADEIKGWGWSKALHPDDLERTKAVWKKAVKEIRPYEIEYRIRRRDGVYRHFLARGIPVIDALGNVTEWVGTCIDITERKKAEEDIRRAQEDLNHAQEVAHVGSWRLDVNKNELTWSDENHRIFGIPAGERMTYQTFLACVHPEDRDYVDREWNAALRGEPYDIEHRAIVGDRIKWIREKAYLEFDDNGKLAGGFGISQDITDRKNYEQALRENEQRFRTVANYTYDWEYWRSPDNQFIYMSPSCEDVTGYTRREFIEDPDLYLRVIHPDDRPRVADHMHSDMADPDTCELEFRLIHRDGRLRWMGHCCRAVLDENGKFLGRRGSNRDITDRKLAEEERKRLLEQLESKNRELQSIVYVASHDLRSPLVNVSGFTGQLTEECRNLAKIVEEEPDIEQLRTKARLILEKDIPDYLKFIKAGAQKMQMVISGLLTISRLGNAQLTIAPLDMNRLIDHIVTSMTFEIQNRGAKVQIEDLPPCMGDAAQINQLFSNLLNNAVKYLDPGRKGLIRVTGKVEGPMSVYSVSDNGVGIAENHREKVFEIFHRLNPNDGIGGDGLGLSIVMRILDRHNGRISLDSEPGKGSTFHVALPTA